MPLGGVDGVFMSIVPVLLTGLEGKSFEEVRIEDYLKAYQTTGRPPLPCPPEPTDENARKALDLPPLFVPHSMGPTGPLPVTLPSTALSVSTVVAPVTPAVGSRAAGVFTFSGAGNALATSTLAASTTGKPKFVNPVDIPAGQEFTPQVVAPGTSASETFQSITGMDEYSFFSVEELRFYAYMRGQKTAPAGIKMDPFVVPGPASGTTGVVGTPVPGSNEMLQSLSANPLYDKHSQEELRVAYLLSNREMTSAELIPGVPAVIPPIVPSTPLNTSVVGALAPAPVITTTPISTSSSLFGAVATTTPTTAPKFSFNFR